MNDRPEPDMSLEADQLANAARLLMQTQGTKNEERWRAEVLRCAMDWARKERAELDELARMRRPSGDTDATIPGVYALACSAGVRLVVFSEGWTGSSWGEGGRDFSKEDAHRLARELDRLADAADEDG